MQTSKDLDKAVNLYLEVNTLAPKTIEIIKQIIQGLAIETIAKNHNVSPNYIYKVRARYYK